MKGTVLIRSKDYWFSCHATVLIQVVPLAVDRLKAFEHGTIGAEVVPGTFVLVPDVMDHETGAIEPVPLIRPAAICQRHIPRSHHLYRNANRHFPAASQS